MPTFTFSEKNILDSYVSPDHGSHGFTTRTSSGIIRRKTTTVVHESYPKGVIDWKNKSFEIGGVTERISDLKSRPKFFSSTREWRWGHSGHQYTVKFGSREWTATSGGIGATMNIYRSHIFRKSEPASISFSSDLSKEEMVFLFLVLVYSEIKREEKASRSVVANAGANAGASATAAC